MQITVQEHTKKYVVLSLAGRVDAFSLPPLQQQLDAARKDGVKHFVLDLSEVLFMDSAGLAILVRLLKYTSTAHGALRLILPRTESARFIFRITQFDRIFPLTTTVEEAIDQL